MFWRIYKVRGCKLGYNGWVFRDGCVLDSWRWGIWGDYIMFLSFYSCRGGNDFVSCMIGNFSGFFWVRVGGFICIVVGVSWDVRRRGRFELVENFIGNYLLMLWIGFVYLIKGFDDWCCCL